jgi:hypothetical protein
MGTWGTGNFESDNGLNVLAFWVNKIVDDIRAAFSHDSQNSLYDADGEGHIVANVDILATLLEAYHFYIDLELSEVSRWKSDYLNTFDRIAAKYTKPEAMGFAEKRREVIVNTFDRLLSMREQLI